MRKLKLDELNRISEEEFKNSEKNPFLIILDNVRSLHNVGSAFRTADAFRAEALYLCGITGTPPHREIEKTALGATESVIWHYRKETVEIVEELKAQGWIVISVEQADNSLMLHNFSPELESKYAFVFGNEVFGVQEAIVTQSDICIEIPQYGTKHSLNISVAIGIVSWHYINHMLGRD